METTICSFEYRVRVEREGIVKAFYEGEYRNTSKRYILGHLGFSVYMRPLVDYSPLTQGLQ